jgi:hypothetical protein
LATAASSVPLRRREPERRATCPEGVSFGCSELPQVEHVLDSAAFSA